MARKKLPDISVQSNTYVLFVLLLFLIPLPWLAGWLVSVLFHELCHWFAVLLFGGQVYKITVGLGGANMECTAFTDSKNILCILAGPVGGFLLALLGHWFPRLAICSWVLSVYNLMPLMPLDGGRALQILWNNPKSFEKFEVIFLMILTVLVFGLSFIKHLGVFPLCVVSALWIKNRKRPCKEGGCKLQYRQK